MTVMARNGELILAIDQGTTNTKALLVDARGDRARRRRGHSQLRYPQPGWVEQDAGAIWHSVREAIDDCLTAAGEPRPWRSRSPTSASRSPLGAR